MQLLGFPTVPPTSRFPHCASTLHDSILQLLVFVDSDMDFNAS